MPDTTGTCTSSTNTDTNDDDMQYDDGMMDTLMNHRNGESGSSSSSNHHTTTTNNTNNFMIRPVTLAFPATQEILEDSNLPFSVCITPLLQSIITTTKTRRRDRVPKKNHQVEVVGKDHEHHDRDDDDDDHEEEIVEEEEIILNLTGIPKCCHCGAPHSSYDTFNVVKIGSITNHNNNNNNKGVGDNTYYLICYLCGRTSSINRIEYELYRKEKNITTPTDDNDDDDDSNNNNKTNNNNKMKTKKKKQKNNNKYQNRSTATFQLPLRLQQQQQNLSDRQQSPSISTSTTTAIFPSILQSFQTLQLPPTNRQNGSQSQTPQLSLLTPPPLYEVDAMVCPPLWFIVLDGSCLNRLYWTTISNVLQKCFMDCPDHVHISLLIASQKSQQHNQSNNYSNNATSSSSSSLDNEERFLGIYQCTSAIPQVLHISSDEYACTEEDLLHHVLHSLVPTNDSQCRNHVLAAVRSLMDYQPQAAFHVPSSSTSSSSSSAPPTTGSSSSSSTGVHQYHCPVAWMTEVITAALQSAASPAGQRQLSSSSPNNNGGGMNHESSSTSLRLPYAGGKITYFLANRPAAVSNTAKKASSSSSIHMMMDHHHQQDMSPTHRPYTTWGGFGGRIHDQLGERYSKEEYNTTLNNNNNNGSSGNNYSHYGSKKSTTKHQKQKQNNSNKKIVLDETDLTPRNLLQRYDPEPNIANYYSTLGKQCAEQALGVDLLLLIDSSSMDIPDFGLALIHPLSIRSGAPGPLLFDLKDVKSYTTYGHSDQLSHSLLYREVLSRTPWQPGMVFGSELRIRLSPGFAVDPTPVTPVPTVKSTKKYTNVHRTTTNNDGSVPPLPHSAPQLAPLYSEAGLMGPGCAVGESAHLWRLGTCDSHSSVTIDLRVTSSEGIGVTDHVVLPSGGGKMGQQQQHHVPLRPVIQTCFAYTTIVVDHSNTSTNTSHKKNSTKPKYKTVRRMKVSSCPVRLAYDVESMYSTLDPEALAVTLFHKLALAVQQDGLHAAALLAQQWLLLLLSCVYRSAETEQERLDDLTDRGIDTSNYYGSSNNPTFYPNERLLDRDGDLSWEDVLLAQGHERLRPVVLMVYLLLQCDALRRYPISKNIGFDLRVAAMLQMSSMTPSHLVRCIAPRLQLWESGLDVHRPLLDVIDLKSEAVQLAIMEYCYDNATITEETKKDLILLLDTPDQIVVMDARYINDDSIDHPNHNANIQLRYPSTSSTMNLKSSSRPLLLSTALQESIEMAVTSYRTSPPVVYELDQTTIQGTTTLRRLVDCLIEDSYCITLSFITKTENFAQWRSYLAKTMQREIEEGTA